jgi:Ca-activated chloride channel family protein
MQITKRGLLVLVLITAMAAFITERASAQTVLMPVINGEVFVPDHATRQIRPFVQQVLPFRVTSSKVHVRIEDNVANTTMEQTFLNQSSQNMEVRVLIPLPAGAAISSSALSMNDQMVEGKLYNSQEAQTIYESIVTRQRDPALLHFVGDNLYEARVFPIPPNQEKRLKFAYTQVLNQDGGLYDFRHILAGSQLYEKGVEQFDLDVQIHSKNTIGPIYSPSHKVSVERPDDKSATIKLTSANLTTDRDFRLFFAPSAGDVALRLVTHRGADNEDGYFMLLGRVDSQLETSKVIPKEIVFVLDISGSMQGEKMEQAQNAIKFCLNSLNERDRFNFISFSTDVTVFSNKMLQATKENVKKAVAHVDQLEATGGTNIDGAMRAAFANDFSEGSGAARMIVFMTDGLPTVGVTDPDSILETVQGYSKKNKVRFFNFGVGHDVNTRFMDKLANENDGVTAYVEPKEDIEVKVSDFFNKIRHPYMTEVALDFGSESKANSIYPKKIPALYRGAEIMMLGRYKGSGPGKITLTGQVAGETRTINVDVNWPEHEVDNPYLPRVWAMRKVGHLMEDLRLHGDNPEIIHELVALAQRHGIVTPYTSQLVVEPGMEHGVPPRPILRGGEFEAQDRRWRDGAMNNMAPKAPAEALRMNMDAEKKAEESAKRVQSVAGQTESGDMATALASMERSLKEADAAKPEAAPATVQVAQSAAGKDAKDKQLAERREALRQLGAAFKADDKAGQFAGGGANGLAADEQLGLMVESAQDLLVKHVGERTFYNRGGVWIDSAAKSDAKPVSVKAFSKEYFDLLKADSTLGAVLALGGKIVVISHDKMYQIEE